MNCFIIFHDKVNLISRADVKEMIVFLLLWYSPNHWGILIDNIKKMTAAKIWESPTTIELARLSSGLANARIVNIVTKYKIVPMMHIVVADCKIALWPSFSWGLFSPQILLRFSNTKHSAIWM